MPKTRLSAVLYLVVVFASGILVGVASNRLYTVKASVPTGAAPKTMAEFRSRYMTEMRKRVGVDAQQEAAVAKILDDTKKKFDDIRREERPLRDRIQQEQIDEIRAVLTDAQRPAYDAWRADRQREQQKVKQNRKAASAATGGTN
jgi:uncharacterized protein YdiU (UPF0061 family)